MGRFNHTHSRSYRRSFGDFTDVYAKLIIYIVMILIAIAICVVPAIMKVSNPQTYVVTVQSKERVQLNKSNSKYLVYTLDDKKESHVFEVTDSLFKLRFDSADVYNKIQPGETYEFTTGGYRIPFFSMYPNIYEFKEIAKEEEQNDKG